MFCGVVLVFFAASPGVDSNVLRCTVGQSSGAENDWTGVQNLGEF